MIYPLIMAIFNSYVSHYQRVSHPKRMRCEKPGSRAIASEIESCLGWDAGCAWNDPGDPGR